MTVSFVIPFHNEEKNCLLMLGKVLDFSKKHKLNFEIIAVDDKSVDQTSSILKKIAQRNLYVRFSAKLTDWRKVIPWVRRF